MKPVRRIVTGHRDGKAVVLFDSAAPNQTAICAGTRESRRAVTPIASDDTPRSTPITIMSVVCANWRTISAPSERKIAPTQ